MNTDMKICVLTYQIVHRKTIDVLCRLKMYGYNNVCVYAKPFHYSKKYNPEISHRPVIEKYDNLNNIGYETLVENLGYKICKIENYTDIKEKNNTIFLLCGAGIIPDEMVHKYCIINSHPGYIPVVRGLDALKWAVLNGLPIGVTTHLLGDYVDAGKVIERKQVDVYSCDTFHAVAYRQYELEVQMLVDAVNMVDRIDFITDGENYPVHKRMPYEMERQLYKAFEQYKEQFCKEGCKWNLGI